MTQQQRTSLVTGGSGTIGSAIIKKLAERGDKVINLSSKSQARHCQR